MLERLRLEKLREDLMLMLSQPSRKIRKQAMVTQMLEMYGAIEYLMAAMKEHDEFATSMMARPMVKVDAKNFEKLFAGREEDKADATVAGHYL